uniref:Putative secreted protein n=1 Tax=Anopheles marajoara TaxID=58244 RepID=A0A2M4C7I4_9DIPT
MVMVWVRVFGRLFPECFLWILVSISPFSSSSSNRAVYPWCGHARAINGNSIRKGRLRDVLFGIHGFMRALVLRFLLKHSSTGRLTIESGALAASTTQIQANDRAPGQLQEAPRS